LVSTEFVSWRFDRQVARPEGHMRITLPEVAEAPSCVGCLGMEQPHAEKCISFLQHWYPPESLPSCHSCGVEMEAEEEDLWVHEATVVSVAWGYKLVPTRFWCRACWDVAPRDEPPALD
jgi:hypothetical protein